MAKPFYRYEDVPLLLASEGQEPVMVFANRASISASQPLEAKKFAEDYNISFANVFEDVEFKGVEKVSFGKQDQSNIPLIFDVRINNPNQFNIILKKED